MNPQSEIDRLCNQWLGLVPWCVNRYFIHRISPDQLHRLGGFDELVSVGNLGLIRAARLYDPKRVGSNGEPAAFNTFAVWPIRSAIHAHLRIAGAAKRRDDRTYGADNFEVFASREPGPLEAAELNELRETVQDALQRLDPRDAKVITMHMGGRTLEEIGGRLGLTRERARQLEARGMGELERMLGRVVA